MINVLYLHPLLATLLFFCFSSSNSFHVDHFLCRSSHLFQAKGFGSKISPKLNQREDLEITINKMIDMHPQLRHALTLARDIDDIRILYPSKLKEIEEKEAAIRKTGWDRVSLQNKLLEITWDATARGREARHAASDFSELPLDTIQHLKEVAHWTLTSKSDTITKSKILDVGCGNGIMIQFLLAYNETLTRSRHDIVGIDLSKEMISIAKEKFPFATFHHSNYFDYLNNDENFETILFNECFHYFPSQEKALQHATTHLKKDINARIIISHPRGYKNVQLQHSKNRILVPHLLPTAQELHILADQFSLEVILPPELNKSNYLTILQRKIK